MNAQEAVISGFRQCVNFKGKATRPEFWWFFALVVVAIPLFIESIIFFGYELAVNERFDGYRWIRFGYCIIITLPMASLFVRRLRDANMNPLWAGLGIIIYINPFSIFNPNELASFIQWRIRFDQLILDSNSVTIGIVSSITTVIAEIIPVSLLGFPLLIFCALASRRDERPYKRICLSFWICLPTYFVLNVVSTLALPVIIVEFLIRPLNMSYRSIYWIFGFPSELLWLGFCFLWAMPLWYLCVKLGGSSSQR